ncbi:MAG TPA: tetratricopeptide repeat protein [Wenzhouxiangella sp.]|nr:tetratricopeptide repeat protein [Wenzhouxiangella sp.]
MTQIKPVLGGIILLLITACSLNPKIGSGDAEGDEESAASYTEEQWSEEVMFQLRAAAHAGGGAEHAEAISQLIGQARGQEDLELLRQAAGMAWRTQSWASLIDATETWRQWEPAADDPRRLQILALFNADRPGEAIDAMRQWLSDSPDEIDRLLRREFVQILAATEQTDQAVEHLDAVIARSSPDLAEVSVLAARSRLHWELGQPDQALELAILALDHSNAREDFSWAAQLASALGDYELALSLYRRARERAPDEWMLGLAEAQTLRELERIDEALVVLSALPDNPDVLYNRASYLYEAGQVESATAAWQDLADLAPVENQNQHAFMVAWLAEFLELDRQAADWYGRVRGGAQVDRAMIRRAVLLAEDDQLAEARELLKLARDTEQADQRERAYLVEAELLTDSGRALEAREILTGALRETPNSIGLLYARAITAVESDDLELAEQDLRRIIRLDGENAMALNALGYTLTDRTSRHNEAYRLIRRALELSPDEPAILDSMGWVYFRSGRPEAALPYLKRAHASGDNPEIVAHLVEVLWQLDEVAEAKEILREASSRYPDSEHLINVTERLEIVL